jgi:hypothetical protein
MLSLVLYAAGVAKPSADGPLAPRLVLDVLVGDDARLHEIWDAVAAASGKHHAFKDQPRMWRLLSLGRQWIQTYLPHVLSKAHRVTYGLLSARDIAQNPEMPASRKMLAVPFVGKNVPSPAAEFANPEVLVGLTILAYRHAGLRLADTMRMVDALKKDLVHQSGPMAYRKAYRTFREEWGVGGDGGITGGGWGVP